MRSSLYVLCVLLVIHFSFCCTAQTEKTYTAKNSYSASSTQLIEKLKYHLDSEMAETGSNSEIVWRLNNKRFKYLKKLVTNKSFIQDSKFESCVEKIVDRLVQANHLPVRDRTVLVVRSSDVNAITYGKGVFFVTLGLLARLRNEAKLAMALAHELGHDELKHVQKNILREADEEQNEQKDKFVKEIVKGTADSEDVESLKKIVYQASSFDRKKEVEADSMGIILIARAGYDPKKGKGLFEILKTPTATKDNLGIALLLPLHSEVYPIQDHWVTDRLSVYSIRLSYTLGLSIDSLKSHPKIEERLKKINASGIEPISTSFEDQADFKEVMTEAQFELLELCYKSKAYDRGIFYALQLLNTYPNDSFLVSRVAEMFLELKNARDISTFDNLVERFTGDYSDELKLVNNLLQNLSTKELGELGYYFLIDERHFNENDRSHYYLKWKLCDATYRYDEAKETKSAYKKKFGSSIDFYRLPRSH
jgi:Zn-dependent protease with chaperone function